MQYRTIPESYYKHMLYDGMRVDRVRELVRKLESTSPILYDKKYHWKLVEDLKKALFDTPDELKKISEQEQRIREAEEEYQKKAKPAAL